MVPVVMCGMLWGLGSRGDRLLLSLLVLGWVFLGFTSGYGG